MNTSGAPVQIELLADHPDLVPTIARWHWDEWGESDPGGSLAAWTASLYTFTNRDELPAIFLALASGAPLGTAGLNACDMQVHPELTPWLSGVFVTPSAREHGVASALVRHVEACAGTWGYKQLYLYTHTAQGLYEKLGWSVISEETYAGHQVAVMHRIVLRGGLLPEMRA